MEVNICTTMFQCISKLSNFIRLHYLSAHTNIHTTEILIACLPSDPPEGYSGEERSSRLRAGVLKSKTLQLDRTDFSAAEILITE